MERQGTERMDVQHSEFALMQWPSANYPAHPRGDSSDLMWWRHYTRRLSVGYALCGVPLLYNGNRTDPLATSRMMSRKTRRSWSWVASTSRPAQSQSCSCRQLWRNAKIV